MNSDRDRVLLVVGAGVDVYREYGLQSIAAGGRRMVLVDNAPAPWARPYVDSELIVDLTDRQAVAGAVKELAGHTPIAGVMTYMEPYTELAAGLAKDLGLPGPSPDSVAACRDKATTRRLLDAHGVPSARSYLVTAEDQAVEYAGVLGYPVVVKPRAIGGSAGVRRADSEAAVRHAFREAEVADILGIRAFAQPGVLVEEYLDGPEISVETVVSGWGVVRIAAVTRKRLAQEPSFEEIGHTVDAGDDLQRDPDILEVTQRAVEALGITHAVLHIEMRLTSTGPRLIEVNGRLGGDLIPLLVELATGINLPRIAAALATGDIVDTSYTRRQAAAVEFLYPPVTGPAHNLRVMTSVMRQPWLERLVRTRQPGDDVTAPPNCSISDRLAHWVVQGGDAAQCAARLDQVADHVVLTSENGDWHEHVGNHAAAAHSTICAS